MYKFSEKYRQLLFGEYSTLNLTRISEADEFYDLQIVDSIYPVQFFSEFENELLDKKLHVDIGFGGGFPLLPVARVISGIESVGFEARRKKAEAVQEIASKLGLDKVKTFHHRVETILFDQNCVITFKAVGKINEFLKKINVESNTNVSVYFYKGPNLLELENVPERVGIFKKKILSEYKLPSGHIRHFVAYEAENVPRGTKKNLVKLSKLH